ncbi:DUF305 domain-containing protein [Endozoicomonas numazuensis]|uniref:DUF305 domain-containing protein n=1 Tax=Endozoicomonas numazuensis TaxID=1137799 RepID=UPI00068C8CF0|nr:DUF305 domain-containing protein [Endozoicomonas numazuensis]
MRKLVVFTCLLFPIALFSHDGIDHTAQNSNEFKAENTQAMIKMHKAMESVQYTGNNDIDFLRMMIPHHQGAIDMAEIILKTTHNKEVKNLAQGIITDQRNEIEIMKQLLEQLQPGKQ